MNASALLERVERLNRIGIALSSEHDTDHLLDAILRGAKELTAADGGSLYLVGEDRNVTFAIMKTDSLGIEMGGISGQPIPFDPLPLEVDGEPNRTMVVTNCVLLRATVNIPDAYDAEGYDFSGTRAFDARTGYRTRSLLTVPMSDHEGTVIGVLQLINATDAGGQVVPFSPECQQLAESLASQAAIALNNRRLVDDLRNLFESFVRLIAQAIDEKSPYTGAHCRRVPELTLLLADAADRSQSPPLAAFRLDQSERYALSIAAWLHDCGKITTPEHVMDKATKLSTIHDRIDEVATRFAVCRARVEAEADLRRREAEGSGDSAAALRIQRDCEDQLAALHDDLAFLREANLGVELMNDDDRQRVHAIARWTWVDSEGLRRSLLTPEEVGNLTIARGTLNDEERRIIQNHVVVSIRMLEELPFPRNMRNVPEYAAGHHERVDGKGYPHGLTRDEMSVPARIMAIADIFEALSAHDRPYKEAKKLSECVEIMGRMRLEGHIDPDLFDVFIDEAVYLDYARQFLAPEQIDEIDPARIPGYSPPAQRRRL